MRVRRLLTVMSVIVFVLSLGTIAWPATTSAAVDTCTWTGATSANWSTGSNWSGCDNGGVPQTGDNLIFPADAANTSMNNDLTITAGEMTFNSGANYTVSGNGVDLSGSLHLYGAASFVSALSFTSATASNRMLDYQNESAVLPSNITLNLTNGANLQIFTTVNSLPMPTFSGSVDRLAIIGDASGTQRTFIAANNSTVTVAEMVYIARATVLCQANNCLGNSNNVVMLANGNNRGAELNVFTDNLVLPYDITLNSLGFDGPPTIAVSGEDAEIQGNITVASNGLVRMDSGKALLLAGGTLQLDSGQTLAIEGLNDGEVVGIDNEITGSGTLNVVAANVAATYANATFSGRVVVDEDGIFDAEGSGLGTLAGGMAVNDRGSWIINNINDTTIAGPVAIAGDGNNNSEAAIIAQGDTVTFNSALTVASDAKITHTSTAGEPVIFASTINGAGSLTLERLSGSASNSFVLNQTSDNSFGGDLRIRGAKAVLTGSALSVPHNLSIEANSVFDAEVSIDAADQLSSTTNVHTVKNGSKTAKLTVNTPTVTMGNMSGDGTIDFTGTGRDLRIGNGDGSSTFSGLITGKDNTITKVGNGTWSLNNVSTVANDTPSFVIESGAITFNGSLPDAPITAAAGTTLKGTGSVGATTIQSGATINVGNSPGCMTMSTLTLANNATFETEIAGDTACSSYDQSIVSGAATLNNASLHIDMSYSPAPGTVFTILKAGTISGTFSGLPEGSTVTANGISMRINYTTTTVTLTYVNGTLAGTGLNLVLVATLATTLTTTGIGLLFIVRRQTATPSSH